jgi:hypothetical protein
VLAAGKELAERTEFRSRLYGADAFISKVISTTKVKSKKISIADSVNETPLTWRAALVQTYRPVLGDISPIYAAVAKSAEAGDSTSWFAPFEKAIRLSAQSEFDAVELAIRFYDEILCHRELKALEEARGK